MTGFDWDRILFLACYGMTMLGGTKVLLVIFTDPKNSDGSEGQSPFKAWLRYLADKDKLQSEFDLEKFRIDKNMVPRGPKD